MSWPCRLSSATALLTTVVIVACCGLTAAAPEVSAGLVFGLVSAVVAGALSTGLGLFVAHRRPGNLVGFLLTLIGLVPPLETLLDIYGEVSLSRPLPGAEAVHQLAAGMWILWYVPVLLLMLYFPGGRVPPGRFPRLILYGVLIVTPVFILVAALDPTAYDPPFERFGHPLPTLPESVIWFLLLPLLGLLMVLLVSSALVMRHRYRAGGPVERAQLKWFGLGVIALPGTLLLCWANYLLFGELTALIWVGLAALSLGVPSLTALAILRHDLYDVDRTTSAVVTWGLLTAGLLTVYSTVSLTGGLALGRGSAVVSAGVTALVAVVLLPAKNRLRRSVDRRFYPVRERALSAVTALEREVHAGRARPEQLEEVLRDALRQPGLRVGFLLPGARSSATRLAHRWREAQRYGSPDAPSGSSTGPVRMRWPPPAHCSSRRYGCGSNSVRRSARWRPAAAGYCAPDTANAAAWSGTCTTAPSRGWSASAWRCGSHSAISMTGVSTSTDFSTRPWPNWARLSRSCVNWRTACGPAPSTTDSAPPWSPWRSGPQCCSTGGLTDAYCPTPSPRPRTTSPARPSPTPSSTRTPRASGSSSARTATGRCA